MLPKGLYLLDLLHFPVDIGHITVTGDSNVKRDGVINKVQNMFDNDHHTFWETAAVPSSSISIQFEEAINVHSVEIMTRIDRYSDSPGIFIQNLFDFYLNHYLHSILGSKMQDNIKFTLIKDTMILSYWLIKRKLGTRKTNRN